MTLALLVPNDYRHAPILLRDPWPPYGIVWTGEAGELERVSNALYACHTTGFVELRLHRDDQPTSPAIRRRP